MTNLSGVRLGVDLGGSKILAALLKDGEVVATTKKPTKAERGYEGVLVRIADVVKETCEKGKVKVKNLESLGIGVPGPVRHNRLLHAPNLGWSGEHLARDLARATGVGKVFVGNDVNCGALGEATLGAGKDGDSVFALFAGTGLGGGWTVGRRVHEGASGFAGEIGHLMVPGLVAPCSCGQIGCLETVASKKGLAQQFEQAIAEGKPCAVTPPRGFKSKELEDAFHGGCPTTVAAIELMAKNLAWVMNAVACVVNPDTFVLGGGIGERLGTDLLRLIDNYRREAVFVLAHGDYVVKVGSLGGTAVALGAAQLQNESLGAKQ